MKIICRSFAEKNNSIFNSKNNHITWQKIDFTSYFRDMSTV